MSPNFTGAGPHCVAAGSSTRPCGSGCRGCRTECFLCWEWGWCYQGFLLLKSDVGQKYSFCALRFALTFTFPLAETVVGAPPMTSQPVFSIFPCSPLPSGTWQTPGLSIPRCCLPTSFSVCLVFFFFSLCLARWFSQDLMTGRHVRSLSLQFASSYDGQEVFVWPDCLLDLGTNFLVGNMVFVRDA